MRRAVLLALLLSACAGSPPPQASSTLGAVPRDVRGDAILSAVPPPPPPPPPSEFKPVTAEVIDCSHLRHC